MAGDKTYHIFPQCESPLETAENETAVFPFDICTLFDLNIDGNDALGHSHRCPQRDSGSGERHRLRQTGTAPSLFFLFFPLNQLLRLSSTE